jgi:hypothetical protein
MGKGLSAVVGLTQGKHFITFCQGCLAIDTLIKQKTYPSPKPVHATDCKKPETWVFLARNILYN